MARTNRTVCACPQGGRTQPGAGKSVSSSDKRLTRMIAKHTRDTSFWPREADFEQMAATWLKCEDPDKAYELGMIEEMLALKQKVSTLPVAPAAWVNFPCALSGDHAQTVPDMPPTHPSHGRAPIIPHTWHRTLAWRLRSPEGSHAPLSVPGHAQARYLARKVHRAPAINDCKKAFRKGFPKLLKKQGKGVNKKVAKQLEGACMPKRASLAVELVHSVLVV